MQQRIRQMNKFTTWITTALILLCYCASTYFCNENVKDQLLHEDTSLSNFHANDFKAMRNFSPLSLLRAKRFSSINSSTGFASKIFNVHIKRKLQPYEFIGLTGSISTLGNWKPEQALKLIRTNSSATGETWSVSVTVPLLNDTEYRYFIGVYDAETGKILIRQWETHIEPRTFKIMSNLDYFGLIDGNESIERGWLNGETIVQLKFYRNPFSYNELTNRTRIKIKINPIHAGKNEIDELTLHPINIPSSEVNVEFAQIKYNQSELVQQTDNGATYNPEDIVIFHITVTQLDKIAYLIYLSHGLIDDEKQRPLGYQYILPRDLTGSEGDLQLPIISASKSLPIGFMKISYLIIRPMKVPQLSLKSSFANYWRQNWTYLDIGHRGLGSSFKLVSNAPPAPENTIASMRQASEAGADMVEFDVHLTKDLIPIIYHDFFVNVNSKPTKPTSIDDLIQVPIKDLTYEQIKALRTYQIAGDKIVEYPSHNEETRFQYRLFPLLEEYFIYVNISVGFDVEIKWPQKYIDGNSESIQTIDKNLFADRILKVLIEKGCGRLIFLSSFDADLCTMFKFKQNIYPVMFLVLGETKRYSEYYDPRCNSIENAVANAQSWNFLGVIPHTEDFFIDPSLAKLATDIDQKIFCWGNDADSQEAVQKLKEYGLTGVIYDRVDIRIQDDKNGSIFNDNELKKLFKKQCL